MLIARSKSKSPHPCRRHYHRVDHKNVGETARSNYAAFHARKESGSCCGRDRSCGLCDAGPDSDPPVNVTSTMQPVISQTQTATLRTAK
jgi:hypothetical protein